MSEDGMMISDNEVNALFKYVEHIQFSFQKVWIVEMKKEIETNLKNAKKYTKLH